MSLRTIADFPAHLLRDFRESFRPVLPELVDLLGCRRTDLRHKPDLDAQHWPQLRHPFVVETADDAFPVRERILLEPAAIKIRIRRR
jgi:hypothetical protein